MPPHAARIGTPGSRRADPAGFTLVEVLVVLAVVAFAFAAVPAVTAGLPGVRLRAAADDLAAALRELQSRAVRRGRATEVVFDTAGRAYTVSGDAAPRRFPDAVERVDVRLPAGPLAERGTRLRFFPDGSATAGTVLLRRGSRVEAVSVEWPTGRVRRGG